MKRIILTSLLATGLSQGTTTLIDVRFPNGTGWDLSLSGLETAGASAITGGSGAWGAGGINDWAEFNNVMRVGASYQTTAAGGNLNVSSITLIQVPEPSAIALLGLAGLGLPRRRRR